MMQKVVFLVLFILLYGVLAYRPKDVGISGKRKMEIYPVHNITEWKNKISDRKNQEKDTLILSVRN